MNWFILAATKPAAQPTTPAGGWGAMLGNPMVMMILILVFFWVIIIIPQRKQQKQRDTLLKNLKKGDKIITTAGIHGEIVDINDDDLQIRIADKVEIKIVKGAVARVKE